MYFARNEIIELNDSNKYLVVDTAYIDETSYYKVEKLTDDKHTNEYLYITATNNEGKLYINMNLSSDVVEKLKEILEKID